MEHSGTVMANFVLAKFNPRTKFCFVNLVLGPQFNVIFGPTHQDTTEHEVPTTNLYVKITG